jgi:hypothetical protein
MREKRATGGGTEVTDRQTDIERKTTFMISVGFTPGLASVTYKGGRREGMCKWR